MYDIDYKDMPRWKADDKAIADLAFYIGKKSFKAFREEADRVQTAKEWIDINNVFGFIGVQGYPVHAFGRRHCLTAYREWMHNGDDPVTTDAQGFKLT